MIFFISKIGGSMVGFLATIYFARVLGEVVLGFYALVLALVTWLTLVGDVGWTSAVTKRVSEGTDQAEFATAGAIIIGALVTIVGIGVIIFQNHVDSYVGQPVWPFIILIAFAVLFRSYFFSLLKGYHLVHIYAPLSTAKIGIRSIAQLALVVFLGAGLAGLLVGYLAGAIFAIGASMYVLRFRPALPSWEHFVSLFNFAKFSWLGNIRGRTFDQVDIIVLGFFVQTGLIGVYSVAWSLSKFLDIFSSAISNTMFPEMSKIAAQEHPESVSGLVEDSLAFGGLFIIPGLVGGTVVADRLMAIYGEGFVVGVLVLPILIVALMIYSYNKQLVSTLNAIDRPDLAFRANGMFIGANVILNIVLIWQIGWVGAAIATATSAGIGLVFSYYYLINQMSFRLPVNEISYQWVAALGMGAIIFSAREFSEANWAWIDDFNAVFVLLLVCLGAIVYFSLLFWISNRFRTTVRDNLPLILRRPG